MLRPIGHLPPHVYWRRRMLFVFGLVIAVVLFAMTVRAWHSGGSSPAAGTHTSTSTSPQTTPAATSVSAPTSSSTPPSTATSAPPTTATSAPPTTTTTTVTHSAAPAPQACAKSALKVVAATQKAAYAVGQQPVLYLQVTNVGKLPCVEDLADSQIVLLVYNGDARAWGSHDCQTQPGQNLVTLAVNQPVRMAITWTGLSSQPGCKGVRQRLGAGTYTLKASLSGIQGTPATFRLT